MCQSKAQGGRRCNGKTKSGTASSTSVATSSLTAVQRALSTLSSIAHSSTPASANDLAYLSSVDSLDDLSPQEHWQGWVDIISGDNPSHAVRAMFDSGYSRHYPELDAIKDVPQDVSWHPEGGVGEHAAQAADVAAQNASREGLDQESRTVAVLGAMCHDLGKATHTQIHSDGRITSRGHDVAGEAPAKRLLARMGADEALQGKVGILVKTHMRHINEPTLKSATKLKAALAEHGLSLHDWARIADADCGGRGEASQHGVGQNWLRYA